MVPARLFFLAAAALALAATVACTAGVDEEESAASDLTGSFAQETGCAVRRTYERLQLSNLHYGDREHLPPPLKEIVPAHATVAYFTVTSIGQVWAVQPPGAADRTIFYSGAGAALATATTTSSGLSWQLASGNALVCRGGDADDGPDASDGPDGGSWPVPTPTPVDGGDVPDPTPVFDASTD